MRIDVRPALCVCTVLMLAGAPAAQSLKLDQQRGEAMLDGLRRDLEEHYYDPTFRGVDVRARVEAARQRVRAATSLGEVFTAVAQVAVDLDDSHTRFYPPARATRVDYGWAVSFVGDHARVSWIAKGSDAQKQGLTIGDRVVEVAGYTLTRQNHPLLSYLLNALRPQPALAVVLEDKTGVRRSMRIAAAIERGRAQLDVRNENDLDTMARQYERLTSGGARHEHHALSDKVHLWRMPFFDLERPEVDAQFDKFRTKATLILDMRGNGGGSEESMLRVLGNLFDRDLTVGTLHERKGTRPLVARTRGKMFPGAVIALVDSESASAAEVVARVLQLERRATVVGDRTAGMVMRGLFFSHKVGTEVAIYYGVSVTVADLVHPDGRSLEKTGVTPDTVMLPSADDLEMRRDPVLSAVARTLDVVLDPVAAYRLYATGRDDRAR